MKIGSDRDLASEFGGTFVSAESGARGERVLASMAYTPDIAEEEARVSERDPLRGRRLSNRRVRSPFSQTMHDVYSWGVRKYQFRGDSSCWPVNGGTVDLEEIADRSDEFDLESHHEPDGEISFGSVDLFAGPKFERLPEGVCLEHVVEELIRKSPFYLVKLYEMAGPRGRYDILLMLPGIVARLAEEGICSRQSFQQERSGHVTVYRALRGYAADERRVMGREGGIACEILTLIGDNPHSHRR